MSQFPDILAELKKAEDWDIFSQFENIFYPA